MKSSRGALARRPRSAGSAIPPCGVEKEMRRGWGGYRGFRIAERERGGKGNGTRIEGKRRELAPRIPRTGANCERRAWMREKMAPTDVEEHLLARQESQK